MSSESFEVNEFLPKYESARLAVERARQIVKFNNEMISKMKSESNILEEEDSFDSFFEAENFTEEDAYTFDLYKIKSDNGVKDFFKGIFGVH